MSEIYIGMIVVTLMLAVGTIFLLVLLRVLEERRDVADARIAWSLHELQEAKREQTTGPVAR
ncbi:MAG: hypothetical protein IRZ08_20690 [Frankia sp.]|nr:hypothetical protein [Frankia sp.]